MSTVSSRFESSFRGGLVERCSRHTRSSRTPSPFRLLVLADALGWRSVSRETEALISFDRTHFVATEPVLSTLRAPILRWCTRETEARRTRDSSIPSQFLSLLSMRGGTSSARPLHRPLPYTQIGSAHTRISPPEPTTATMYNEPVLVSRETAIEPLTPSNDRRGLAKPQRAWGVLM